MTDGPRNRPGKDQRDRQRRQAAAPSPSVKPLVERARAARHRLLGVEVNLELHVHMLERALDGVSRAELLELIEHLRELQEAVSEVSDTLR